MSCDYLYQHVGMAYCYISKEIVTNILSTACTQGSVWVYKVGELVNQYTTHYLKFKQNIIYNIMHMQHIQIELVSFDQLSCSYVYELSKMSSFTFKKLGNHERISLKTTSNTTSSTTLGRTSRTISRSTITTKTQHH